MDVKEREKKALEIAQKMDELDQLEELDRAVQANEIEFDINDRTFRVRKPTLRETNLLNRARTKRYSEMLEDDAYKFEDQLIELAKKKGCDLNKMQLKLLDLQRKEENLFERLAKTSLKSDVEKLENEIVNIRIEKSSLLEKRNDLLKYSIESQLVAYMNEYLLSMILEEKVDKNWVKVFQKHEAYLECQDEELLIVATYKLSLLVVRNAI